MDFQRGSAGLAHVDHAPTAAPRRAAVRLMVTTGGTGTFTNAHFRSPLLPTAPALAPAAGASPGGLEGELAGPDPPGPGDDRLQETPEVASRCNPRPGCMGWVGV